MKTFLIDQPETFSFGESPIEGFHLFVNTNGNKKKIEIPLESSKVDGLEVHTRYIGALRMEAIVVNGESDGFVVLATEKQIRAIEALLSANP